jgi:DNA-binding NarL/FixJ family response regulator
MPVPRLSVLLADDHEALLQRVVKLLKPDYEIVGTVGDGRALIEAAVRLDPEIIISDISMPEMSGIEAVREIRKAGITAKVVFLTVHEDSDFVPECFGAGGLAYVVKSRIASDLLSALRMILTNHTFVSPTVPWQSAR